MWTDDGLHRVRIASVHVPNAMSCPRELHCQKQSKTSSMLHWSHFTELRTFMGHRDFRAMRKSIGYTFISMNGTSQQMANLCGIHPPTNLPMIVYPHNCSSFNASPDSPNVLHKCHCVTHPQARPMMCLRFSHSCPLAYRERSSPADATTHFRHSRPNGRCNGGRKCVTRAETPSRCLVGTAGQPTNMPTFKPVRYVGFVGCLRTLGA